MEKSIGCDSKKKVGIATFIDSINYGALLQAYALGQYLSSTDCQVYYITSKDIKSSASYIGIKKLFYELIAQKRISAKETTFSKFRDKYFALIDNVEALDILICGSDQIWNIQITEGYDSVYWGEGCKCSIGYAVSCGELELLKDTIDIFREKVKNFSAISVRENDLARLTSEVFGKKCSVVCDPSLLLTASDYEKISNPIRLIKKDYVLIYQMGKNSFLYSVAKKIAKKKGLRIIEINNNMFDYLFKFYPRFYSRSVEDFLALFRDASYIVTNSFHGTVFSLIYQKPFYSIKSKSRNARIIDLLSRIGLEERILEMAQNIEQFIPIDINYEEVNVELERFIKESKQFLNEAIIKF